MSIFTFAKSAAPVAAAAALSISLAACGSSSDESLEIVDPLVGTSIVDPLADPDEAEAAAVPTFGDGFDICFSSAVSALGEDAMVHTIRTRFSPGAELSTFANAPRGELTSCAVEYQNPDNPVELMSMTYSTVDGGFSEPEKLDITVVGDAAEFSLDDFVVRLGDVNVGPLGEFMESKKSELDAVFSDHEWVGVTLQAPANFSPEHSLVVDFDGRLASNDVAESGSAVFEIDGTTLRADNLLP